MNLEPTRTAPDFSANPLAYYTWHLLKHSEMYLAFRQHADLYRAVDPGRRLSADMICHVLRYHTGLKATDDQYQVNNVLTPFYARLYLRQRPGANVSTRASQLDDLTDEVWAELLALLPEEGPQ